jgi:hypothetical protein
MSQHRKAPGPKAPGGKKQKTVGPKDVKEKTVAAEAASPVMREEAPKSVSPVAAKYAAKAKAPTPPPVKQAAKAKTPAPLAVKQAPKAKAPAPRPAAAKDEGTEPPRRLLETAVDTFERTFKAAGQGTIAVNRKLLDFTRANVASGFDFAMSLAGATSPMQLMQLQMRYWDERMKVLASQAEELRALSAELVAMANEPIREHVRRSSRARTD